MKGGRKVNMNAGRGARYSAPQNDYGSASMPMSIPTVDGTGGRAYPASRVPRAMAGEARASVTAKGDHSSSIDARSRPTPSAGDALPMNGGSKSTVRHESSRRSGGMK